MPGPSVAVQASVSSPPGKEAQWFWSYDCSELCEELPIVGGDVGVTYGWPREAVGNPVALSVGVSGILYPYVDGYVQLAEGQRPFGIGLRVGPPVTRAREHQLYGRLDLPLGASTRLMLSPALFIHEGNSPNGENHGSFIGFVQGIGLLLEGEWVSWTPAVALVAGSARRDSYGRRFGPTTSVFGAASIGFTFHRRRSRPSR